MCDQHGKETDETEKETDIVDPPESPTEDDNENREADQDLEQPTSLRAHMRYIDDINKEAV